MIKPWEEHGWDKFGCRKIPFIVKGRSYIRNVWIETGTDSGFTTAWAMHNKFTELHTIDINPYTSNKVREMFIGCLQVHVHCGDSRKMLSTIIDPHKDTTFFLDAHYQLRDNDEEMALGCQCPLLEELLIITSFTWTKPPLLIIDDSHLFTGPRPWSPQKGSRVFIEEQWPTIQQINKLIPDYVCCEILLETLPSMLYCYHKSER